MIKTKPWVWLVLDSRAMGGIESHVLQLARGLQQHNVRTKVVFLQNYGQHPLTLLLNELSIPYQCLDGKFSTYNHMIKGEKPALIHSHGYKAGIFSRILAKCHQIPIISTYHAGESPRGLVQIYDFIDRYTGWLANQVYAVSEQIAARLPIHALLVRNFVPSPLHIPLSKGKKIAFVGRLSHEKGPDLYLQLAALFQDQQFHIYGDGPMQKTLESQATYNVHFHGQQANMQTIWPDIGLLIMPSRFEGLPMAAIEAMGHGIPVIAFNVGALNQLIQHYKNGWLVARGNKALLSQYLQVWLLMSSEKKREIQRSAQITIHQQFSSEVIVPQLIHLYQQFAKIVS